jgi:hypothetical protein
MELEKILAMDPYIFLSMVNMKLRDFYSSLESLCQDWDVEAEVIEDKLKAAGYVYNRDNNQFIAQ